MFIAKLNMGRPDRGRQMRARWADICDFRPLSRSIPERRRTGPMLLLVTNKKSHTEINDLGWTRIREIAVQSSYRSKHNIWMSRYWAAKPQPCSSAQYCDMWLPVIMYGCSELRSRLTWVSRSISPLMHKARKQLVLFDAPLGGPRQNLWMKLIPQKLERWGYCMVKIAWSYRTRAFDCRQNVWPWMTCERDSRMCVFQFISIYCIFRV